MPDIGTLNPEQMLQQQQILRQQKMAELLMNKPAPQGQMIGNRYVAPSWTQNLASLANTYVGQRGLEKADQAQLDLAKAIRGQETVALADYMGDLQGKPATQKQTELAGPYGQAGEGGANVPMPMATKDIPAVPANPMLANMNALQNPNSPAFLRAHAMKKITEGPNWAEVSQFNQKTGNTETYVYDKNSADPKSTMRFVSVSKPALSPHEQLTLNDSGIGTGRFGGNAVGGSPMDGNPNPTINPVMNPNFAVNPSMGGATVKPVSSNNVSEDALIKTYGYDPFKPPAMPAMPSGTAARAWKADIYKPIEGTPANTVTGATTYVDALGKYNDYINGLSAKDLANPQVRTKLTSLYSQVKLTGKEANNLGVLNGGDEKILEAVVPNYSDILVTKKTVQKILDEQKEFGSSKIVATYRTAQKPVPENMRKYVVVPKVEETQTTQGSPKQTGATARAVLNGEQIEVRNGKWVNSATGQEVK